MTVVCKVDQCPYRSISGFCRNRVVSITQSGFCGHIYDKQGQIKSNWQQKISEEFMQGYYKNQEEEENER